MIRADIAIGVWWRASAELGCSPSLKGQQWPWHGGRGPPKSLNQLLQPWRGGRWWWCSCLRVRIARQPLFLSFPFLGNVRQVSQILVETNRTDHGNDVRRLCARSVLRAAGATCLLRLLCPFSLCK